jgi:glucans biosynthesis protein
LHVRAGTKRFQTMSRKLRQPKSLGAVCFALLLVSSCARSCGGAERSARPEAGAPPRDNATPRGPASPPAFFGELSARARALAEKPAAPAPEMDLPSELQRLDYDGYRNIRFRPERSWWRGEPGQFELQFFHPGPAYREPVWISVLEQGREHPIPFSPELFSYQGLARPVAGTGLEFTGFRVHAPINQAAYRDEVVAFHGASYFRAVGKGDVYGASARGLAIDLGTAQPEEFPRFSHFYLVRPGANDSALWILALLESRRATGAYAFRVEPGATTTIEVSARLFVRDAGAVLGLAPLSSMYLCGEEAPNCFGDFRPEIHDSDGLELWAASGERLFRPLRNPQRTVSSSFRLDAPRGFGLVQRDRDFDHYQDLEARYQDRPSVWIEPLAGFSRGSVRLLEIAARSETGDNIALAWVPDTTPALPAELELRYRLHFGKAWRHASDAAGSGHVTATRLAHTEHGLRVLVDFALTGAVHGRPALVLSSAGARVLEQHLEDNPHAQTLRASFELARDPGAQDVELRAFLKTDTDTLTETWSYAWQAN